MAGNVRVYIATSMDGFIAGPGDELDWLPNPPAGSGFPEGAVSFTDFLTDIGAMLMGRRTYDVVRQLSSDWFYGDLPVLVATHRPFTSDLPSVRAVTGDIHALLDQALDAAGGKDVYIDGGRMIRAALEVDRVDAMIVTVVPILLGQGLPLFAGLGRRVPLDVERHVDFPGGMVQLAIRPTGRGRG